MNPKMSNELESAETVINPRLASEKAVLEIGDIIKNRFILEEELGRGGMGVVFKAKDLRKEEAKDRNPYIALKVLNEDFKNNPESFIALQRETCKTQELAHPNIITVYDFDRDGNHIYMTMEWLQGKPLSTLLFEQYFRSCPLKERWSIIKQISLALAYAHQKNIIHLDLKPSNIYVKHDGTVKVLDFGIARVAKNPGLNKSQDLTIFDAGTLGAITPSYASCEMLENQDPDFRDDIYALACVSFEILANQHPFNRMQATHACFKKVMPPPIFEISKKQYKALMHGLAFIRKDRVPTIEQFLKEAQLSETGNTGLNDILSLKSFIITTTVIAITMVWQNNDDQTKVTKEIPTIDDSDANKTNIKLTRKEQKKISRMLKIAAMHFMVGRLVDPQGTNALSAYNEVLLIDPKNQAALKGIDEIANYYNLLARELWGKGEKKLSIEMLNNGLRASPKNEDLLTFQDKTHVGEY